MKNGMTENEFDIFFNDNTIHRLYFYNMTDKSFILGGTRFGYWAKWLELIQLMSLLGLIKVSTNKLGKISYSIPKS